MVSFQILGQKVHILGCILALNPLDPEKIGVVVSIPREAGVTFLSSTCLTCLVSYHQEQVPSCADSLFKAYMIFTLRVMSEGYMCSPCDVHP